MQEMDAVFRALSDPARRRLLDRLNERNGLTLTELSADMGMTRQSVSKHLDVLEEAELVATLRRGREKLHYLNAAPINDIADRWIHHYDRARAEALADLKTALEATPMDQKSNETTFVYTTYIEATPERVWQGLTDPDLHGALLAAPEVGRRLLPHGLAEGLRLRRHLRRGRTRHQRRRAGGPRVRSPRRLAYTWHTFTPEWAATHGIDEGRRPRWRAEPRSKVAFDIEEAGRAW